MRQTPSHNKPFKCQVCYQHFASASSLKEHMREHGSTQRCSKCGKPGEEHFHGCY